MGGCHSAHAVFELFSGLTLCQITDLCIHIHNQMMPHAAAISKIHFGLLWRTTMLLLGIFSTPLWRSPPQKSVPGCHFDVVVPSSQKSLLPTQRSLLGCCSLCCCLEDLLWLKDLPGNVMACMPLTQGHSLAAFLKGSTTEVSWLSRLILLSFGSPHSLIGCIGCPQSCLGAVTTLRCRLVDPEVSHDVWLSQTMQGSPAKMWCRALQHVLPGWLPSNPRVSTVT